MLFRSGKAWRDRAFESLRAAELVRRAGTVTGRWARCPEFYARVRFWWRWFLVWFGFQF